MDRIQNPFYVNDVLLINFQFLMEDGMRKLNLNNRVFCTIKISSTSRRNPKAKLIIT